MRAADATKSIVAQGRQGFLEILNTLERALVVYIAAEWTSIPLASDQLRDHWDLQAT